MQLTIDPDASSYEESDGFLLLPAKDTARRRYTVAVPAQVWEGFRRTHGEAASEHVQRLIPRGTWDTHRGHRVRRVGRP